MPFVCRGLEDLVTFLKILKLGFYRLHRVVVDDELDILSDRCHKLFDLVTLIDSLNGLGVSSLPRFCFARYDLFEYLGLCSLLRYP